MQRLLKGLAGSAAYRRAFFSFIAVLMAVVVGVSCFFYRAFLARQREEIDRNVEMSLSQMEGQVSEKLNEMLHIVLSIERNNLNGVFTYAPLQTQGQRDALLEELEHLISNNSFVRDMSYLSLMDENQVYSTQGVFSRESFDKYVYGLTEAFDQEAFSQRLRSLNMCTLSSWQLQAQHEPFQPMAFVYGLPFMASSNRRYVAFYTDKAQLDALIDRLLPCEVQDVRIYEQDSLVYSRYGQEEMEGECVFCCESMSTAYRYQLLARRRVVYAAYYYNLSFFFALLGVTMLVILLSAGMAAQYNVSPLHRLMQRLEGHLPGRLEQKDELALLGDLVESIIQQRQRLARGLFVSNLVWEQYESLEALETAAQEAGIAFEYPLFTCCCGRCTTAMDGDALCAALEDALDTPGAMAVAVKRHEQDRFTVLMNHTDEQSAVETLKGALAALQCEGMHAGASEAGKDVLHLSALHEQASRALHFAIENSLPLVCYDQLPREEEAPAPHREAVREGDLKTRILECMERSLRDNSLSLESLAGECGISTSYLVRYFRGCMGITPMQYVDTRRMEMAKQLLTTTGCTLREIVEQCGYLDESNFARKFKKQEGMTPMSYRKENWQKQEEQTCKK